MNNQQAPAKPNASAAALSNTEPPVPAWCQRIRRMDARWAQIERIAVVIATTAMTGLIFFAVMWRLFAQNSDGDAMGSLKVGLVAFALVAWGCFVGLGKRRGHTRSLWPLALGLAAGITTTVGALGYAMVALLPSGLVFGQRLALALMLWVVFLGASIAARARSHIALQAVVRWVPKHRQQSHAAIGLGLAALFSGFLALQGAVYACNNLTQWIESSGATGVFDSLPLPYWAVTMAIPLGFASMALRMATHAAEIYLGLRDPIAQDPELAAAHTQPTDAAPCAQESC